MARDSEVLEMLAELPLDQARVLEAYIQAADKERWGLEANLLQAQQQVTQLTQALGVANIRLGGIALLLQGK